MREDYLLAIRAITILILTLMIIAVGIWFYEQKPISPWDYSSDKDITITPVKIVEIPEFNLVNPIDENDEWEQFICTAYSTGDPQQGTQLGITKAGFDLSEKHIKDLPICAVDTDVIPLYSVIEVEELGAFIALDTGGNIQGYWIDLLFETKDEAIEFGRQIRNVRIING